MDELDQVTCSDCGTILQNAVIEVVDADDGGPQEGGYQRHFAKRKGITLSQFIKSRWGAKETDEGEIENLVNISGQAADTKGPVFVPTMIQVHPHKTNFLNFKDYKGLIPAEKTNFQDVDPFSGESEDFVDDELVWEVLDTYKDKLVNALKECDLHVSEATVTLLEHIWQVIKSRVSASQKQFDKREQQLPPPAKRTECHHFLRFKTNDSSVVNVYDVCSKRSILNVVAYACFQSGDGISSWDIIHMAEFRKIPYYQGIDFLIGPALVSRITSHFSQHFSGSVFNPRLGYTGILDMATRLHRAIALPTPNMAPFNGNSRIRAAYRILQHLCIARIQDIWPIFVALIIHIAAPCEHSVCHINYKTGKRMALKPDFDAFSLERRFSFKDVIDVMRPVYHLKKQDRRDDFKGNPAWHDTFYLWKIYKNNNNRSSMLTGDTDMICALAILAASMVGKSPVSQCTTQPPPFNRDLLRNVVDPSNDAMLVEYLNSMDSEVLVGVGCKSAGNHLVQTPNNVTIDQHPSNPLDLESLNYQEAMRMVGRKRYVTAQKWRNILAKEDRKNMFSCYDVDQEAYTSPMKLLYDCATKLQYKDTDRICTSLSYLCERMVYLRGDWLYSHPDMCLESRDDAATLPKYLHVPFEDVQYFISRINLLVSVGVDPQKPVLQDK